MKKTYLYLLAVTSLILVSCGSGSSGTSDVQTKRFRITNKCSYTIWIQQQNMADGTPVNVKIETDEYYDYDIPAEGLASTRLWPKKGCDSEGNDCVIGQSSNPCPDGGCPPPVDSKIEATWGCTLADKSACGSTPQGDKMLDTYWNSSAVDGYTFPFTVTVSGNTIHDENQACENVDCADLSLDDCPTAENLSEGQSGSSFPEYNSEDLSVKKADDDPVIGCYSPCKKFNYPTFSGIGIDEDEDPTVIYCCPTPPIESAECSAGPVIATKYVETVHTACKSTVYAYAYDDANGLRHCSAITKIHMTIGPNCP